jgi:hypothetical protein
LVFLSYGYLPTDPRLMKFFEALEVLRIPITTHCSTGGVPTSHEEDDHQKISFKFLDDNKFKKNFEEYYDSYTRWGSKIFLLFF